MLGLLRKLRSAAALIHPRTSPWCLCKRIKYYARGLAFPAATAEWFKILQNPALAVVVRHSPKLYQKLQRPYLTSHFHTPQRLQSLRHHYQFVVSHLAPGLLREIHSVAGKCLAALPAEGAGRHQLRLAASRLDKEGELAITLQNPEGLVMFTLTFSITRCEAGHREILIGGLQGNQSANDRDLIIVLTRRWHGLRPKALLLFAIQQLAALWGVTRVRAVGDNTHIYRHWRQRKHLASSYDEWWLEAGGHLAGDGLFDLPARFVPRDIAALKTNKRPVYRRRYLMLAGLADQFAISLGLPPANPMTVPSRETTRSSARSETCPRTPKAAPGRIQWEMP